MSTPPEPSDDLLRAGDQDRQRTADRLARAVARGELTADEHAERAARAAAARTRGELAELTRDLAPDPDPAAPAAADPEPWQRRAATPAPYERPGRGRIAHLASGWRSWAGTAVVLTAIWGVASWSAGHLTAYWPVWPLGFWAVGLIVTGIRGSRDD